MGTLDINGSVDEQDIGKVIKKYVISFMAGSVCQTPGKVCLAGPPDRQELVVFPGKEDPEGLEVEREREGLWDFQGNQGNKA